MKPTELATTIFYLGGTIFLFLIAGREIITYFFHKPGGQYVIAILYAILSVSIGLFISFKHDN